MELSRTLVETGRVAGPGPARPVDRDDGARRRLREQQLARPSSSATRRRALAAYGRGRRHGAGRGRETAVLLRLLDLALAARVPAARGRCARPARRTASG